MQSGCQHWAIAVRRLLRPCVERSVNGATRANPAAIFAFHTDHDRQGSLRTAPVTRQNVTPVSERTARLLAAIAEGSSAEDVIVPLNASSDG